MPEDQNSRLVPDWAGGAGDRSPGNKKWMDRFVIGEKKKHLE